MEMEKNIKNEVIFNGEYLDGKRWNGFGKVYNYSFGNTPVFLGKYLNGKRWNGIAFDLDENKAVKYLDGEKKDLNLDYLDYFIKKIIK